MWKAQFARKKFTFEHPNLEDFEVCFFQKKVTVIWLLFRAFVLGFLFTCLLVVYSIQEKHSPWYKLPIHFGQWTSLTSLTYFILAFVITVLRYRADRRTVTEVPSEKTPAHYKAMWVIYTITVPCTTSLGLMFWIFIYDPKTYPNLFTVTTTNGLFPLGIAVDVSLNTIPFNFYHFYAPFIFCLTYGVFTLIYQSCGGTGVNYMIPIYARLDWRKPGQACLTGFLYMIATLLAQIALCALSTVKMSLRRRREEAEAEPEE